METTPTTTTTSTNSRLTDYLAGISVGLVLVSCLKVLTSFSKSRQMILIKATAITVLLSWITTDTLSYNPSVDSSSVLTFQSVLASLSIQTMRVLLLYISCYRATTIVGTLRRWRNWITVGVVLFEGVPGHISAVLLILYMQCIGELERDLASTSSRCLTLLTGQNTLTLFQRTSAVADYSFIFLILIFDIIFVCSLFNRLSSISGPHSLLKSRTVFIFSLYICVLTSLFWQLINKLQLAWGEVRNGEPTTQAWRFMDGWIFVTVAEFGMDVGGILESCRKDIVSAKVSAWEDKGAVVERPTLERKESSKRVSMVRASVMGRKSVPSQQQKELIMESASLLEEGDSISEESLKDQGGK
ncbi:hypothetical protein HDV00_002298 [Rhizophlyctis rosea]|nr:hypothetical protein HDV00_002298 [Rhizophlyctis rosea]